LLKIHFLRKMRVAANLTMLYTDVPLLARYERAAADGFKLVEVSLPYSEKAEDLKSAADSNGLSHILINAPAGNWSGGQRGIAALASHQIQFSKSIETSIEYAKTLQCRKVHVMAGIPTDSDLSNAATVFHENIRYASEKLGEHGMECLIEPINPITIPGYHLNSYDQALSIIDRLGLSNLSIQFDLFHAAQMSAGMPTNVDNWKKRIGHVQVAQSPSRGEPDTEGMIDYGRWFEWLKSSGEDWVIGCEYTPITKSFDWVNKFGLQF
ncbi:hypothetical protein PFISCL1PPCAC_5918, partial [Pristionchus fissidentatus]